MDLLLNPADGQMQQKRVQPATPGKHHGQFDFIGSKNQKQQKDVQGKDEIACPFIEVLHFNSNYKVRR